MKKRTYLYLLPKNLVFNIHYAYGRELYDFGIDFLKFTLWIDYGGSLVKNSKGLYRKTFNIGLSNYYKHDYYNFITL